MLLDKPGSKVSRPCQPWAREAAFHGASSRMRREWTKFGAEVGSTTAIKTLLLPGMIPPLSGYFSSANDNVALVAANDNNVVAARLAA